MGKESKKSRRARGAEALNGQLTYEERQASSAHANRMRWERVRQERAVQTQAILDAAAANPTLYGDLPGMLTSPRTVHSTHVLLEKRKMEELLPGPNPFKAARDDPGRLWAKSMHDLYVQIRGVRDHAGGDIVMLTSQWSAGARRSYRERLEAIRTTLTEWITALQEEDSSDATERAVCGRDGAQ